MAHQIEKKFIKNDAVDGAKLKLLNNQAIRSRNSEGTADVELLKLDSANKLIMAVAPIVTVEGIDGKSLQTRDQINTLLGDYFKKDGSVPMEGAIGFALSQASAEQAMIVDYALLEGAGPWRIDITGMKFSSSAPDSNAAATDIASQVNAAAPAQLSAVASGSVVTVTGLDGTLFSYVDDTRSTATLVQAYQAASAGGDALYKITGLANGVATTDAVNKGQLDVAKSEAVSTSNAYTDGQIAAIPSVDLTPFVKKDGSVEMEANLEFALAAGSTTRQPLGSGDLYDENLYFWSESSGTNELYIAWAGTYSDSLGPIPVGGSILYNGWTYYKGALAQDWGGGEMYYRIYREQVTVGGPVHKITGIADGTAANDAVNKGQLDAAKNQAIGTSQTYTDDQIALIPAVDLTPYFKKDGSVNMLGNILFNPASAGSSQISRFFLVEDFEVNMGENKTYAIAIFDEMGGQLQGTIYSDAISDGMMGSIPPQNIVEAFHGKTLTTVDGTYTITRNGPGAFATSSLDITGPAGYVFTHTASASWIGSTSLFQAASVASTGYQIKNLADGTLSGDAVNKGQLDSAASTIGARIDGVEQDVSNVSAEVAALAAGLKWRPSAFLISEDAELAAAVEGSTVASILPMLDDEAPQLTIADFAAGMYLIAKNGVSSKVMKVYDDAGTLKVTFLGVTAIVEGHAFVVKHDLIDSPAEQENNSIWHFDGQDMVKLGDFDWALASGILLTSGYAAVAGVVAASDSVEAAIAKLDGNIQAEILRASDAETGLDSRLNSLEGEDLGTRVSNLESVAFINDSKLLDGTDVTNGYVDLAHVIKPNSLALHIGRLGLHETEDYTLSVVNSVTRITFVNSLAVGGDEAIEAGFKIFWKYQA